MKKFYQSLNLVRWDYQNKKCLHMKEICTPEHRYEEAIFYLVCCSYSKEITKNKLSCLKRKVPKLHGKLRS